MLLHHMMQKEAFSLEKLRAVVFAAGSELQGDFPARALREQGFSWLSMLSVQDKERHTQLHATAYVEGDAPLLALRGAAPVDRAPSSITEELLGCLLEENQLQPIDCQGLWLTTTEDVDISAALQPIPRELRLLGSGHEISVPNAARHMLRVLLLAASHGASPRHVYLREARQLRPDLQSEG